MADATMKITAGPAAGTELAVRDELLIGRAAEGEGALASDPELSRQHARITVAQNVLTIADLGSTNGTRVNGELISGPRQLRRGDLINVGSSTIEVLEHEVQPPASTHAYPKFSRAAGPPQKGAVAPRRVNALGPLIAHNLKLLLGDPGPIILYLAIPVLSILVMRPTMKTILVQEGFTHANGSEQAVPGFMIMFMFLWVITLGRGFFIEHGWNTWERLRASQTSVAQVVAGKLIPGALLILAQIVITILIGVTVFGMTSKGPLLVLLIVVVPLVTCVLAMTAAIVASIQTYAQLEAIGNLILIVFAAMGGALTPVQSLPSTIRAIGHAFPSYWALEAARNVILDGKGVSGVLVPAAVLAGMTALFAVIAALRFSSSQAKRIEI